MGNLAKTGIASGLAITFAVALYLDSSKMSFEGYLLPRLLSVVIILLSLGMVFEAWRCQCRATDSGCAVEAPIDKTKAFVFVAMICGYIVGIHWLGYFVATPAFIIGALRYLKAMTWKGTLLLAVGFTLFVYLLFVSFLQLPIPLGPME